MAGLKDFLGIAGGAATLSSLINPASLIIQGGLGLGQLINGSIAAKRNKAPVYKMPAEYGQNLAEAQNRAAAGLPSASKQLAIDQMSRGTAAGLAKLQDRNMVSTGVASLAQAESDQANKLAAMDAEARLRGELQVANARSAIAGAKDREFALKREDYLQRAAANAGLKTGGIQNLFSGLQNFGMMGMMKDYYGDKKTAGEVDITNDNTTLSSPWMQYKKGNNNTFLGMFK